ncbi:MAG: glycosyltransferase family 39 protein [Candidatus Binataceae bacterium]
MRNRTTTIAAAALAIALIAGVGLRTVALNRVPRGFNQDEACNGYDAYSLLTTGRDQHGNFLPLTIQAFNDYRMPLFDYSLTPVIGLFGLKPWAVRFGAAIWGIADLIAIALIAAELIDIRAAAIAVSLLALSPWHLIASRLGHEAITSSATISWAAALFITGVKRREAKWLIASGPIFGLSLYSYPITKLAAPLIIGWLAILYWRELRTMARAAAVAAGIFMLAAIPQAGLLFAHGAAMQAHFRQLSVLGGAGGIAGLVRNWIASFGPAFLFGGGGLLTLAPDGMALLWPMEAVLAMAGLAALFNPRRCRTALLLTGWIAVAAMPGAMIRPAPAAHPLHDLLMAVPVSLLAALGGIFLLDLELWKRAGRTAVRRAGCATLAGLAAILVIGQGICSTRTYFSGFSAGHEWLFQYGAEPAVRNAKRLAPPGAPIVIPLSFNQPYIYVLFFNAYPPRRFFSKTVVGKERLFGSVLGFDRYRFGDPWRAYRELPHGAFVFPRTIVAPANPMRAFAPRNERVIAFPALPAPPAMTIRAGRDVYEIVVK